MSGDGVIDLTPDDSDVTLPIPPRPLAVAPEPAPADAPAAEPGFVTLRGRRFPVSDEPVPTLKMLKFATIAKRQAALQPGQQLSQADAVESAVIVYELLQVTIRADAWDEFEAHANATGATNEELQAVLQRVAEVRAGRPTQPSPRSSGGPPGTVPSSAAGSSPQALSVPMGSIEVQRQYEAGGRVDIAQAVKRAREASTRFSTG